MADGDARRPRNRGKRGSGIGDRGSARPGLAVDVVTSAGVRAPGLAAWLAGVAPARVRGGVTVAIVPDARVRALNRQYRRKDAPTDVLSFPSDERGYLGDVVIAGGVARRQAREAGHAFGTELRVLALHGLLHLLGYDHERDDGRMARLERRLRRRGDLVEGLIERTTQ
ncbi:MAG TPA: rRNA maturation RNase YbeY [Vicinamibacterales bacterium]